MGLPAVLTCYVKNLPNVHTGPFASINQVQTRQAGRHIGLPLHFYKPLASKTETNSPRQAARGQYHLLIVPGYSPSAGGQLWFAASEKQSPLSLL
ncbi:hypothetical protein Enr17x_23660 [Gimesia fumaroli]|uniref:Uncharacterized protein n=1 Tax=Gimesia fumaroli TaxID=2527976 RepID=A0A518IB47_9PLAN|nr:hypothetical protein Enr17x_23660 [Gimesia fumaroli]